MRKMLYWNKLYKEHQQLLILTLIVMFPPYQHNCCEDDGKG